MILFYAVLCYKPKVHFRPGALPYNGKSLAALNRTYLRNGQNLAPPVL